MSFAKHSNNRAPCLNTPNCLEWTGHGSGYCEKCRIKTCVQCGLKFTANLHRATLKRALCGNCNEKAKGKLKRNGG